MNAPVAMPLAKLAGLAPPQDVLACRERLDASAPDDYRQLAALLVADWRERFGPQGAAVGIGGGQGAGKSTLGRLIAAAGAALGIAIEVLSLDDFYLTRAEREALAATDHPLLATRGPPGTHAIGELRQAMLALRRPGVVSTPRFDKGRDDRAGATARRGPARFVVVEGWCVGAAPGDATEPPAPINALERDHDPRGRWRAHIEAALGGEYAALFAALDSLIFLQVPNLAAVRRWRLAQERERPAAQRMTPAEVGRFVEYYERVTRRMLATLPNRADVVVVLDAAHRVADLRFRGEGSGARRGRGA